jgi:hypothetical protein
VDPYIVWLWQVCPWVGASLLMAMLFGRVGALCVALSSGLAALVWVLLADRYRRGRNEVVSDERQRGDRVMDANGLLALGLSLGLAVAVAAVGLDPVVEPVWGAIPLSIPLLSILISSAIDWYVILPFRDGVTGFPACRIEDVELSARRRCTKLWIAHRLICEISIAVSLLVAGILLVNHYAHNLEPFITVAGALGISAAAARVAWDRWVLGGLRFCLRQGPALGNWVAGPSFTKRDGEKMREGFVLDVSLDNGLKVVASPGATEHFIALKDAVPDISVRRGGYACGEGRCRSWLRTDRGEDGKSVSCEIYRLEALAARGSRL